MGDVVTFRTKRLTGFIPDEIGAEQILYRAQQKRARGLILFAKMGQPTIILSPPLTLEEPFSIEF